MIEDDPGASMQKLATNFNVHRTTVLRAIYEDLRYKSYVLKVRQNMLSDAMKARRLESCELLITSLNHGAASRSRFFLTRRSSVLMRKSTARMTGGFARTQLTFP